MSNVTSLTEIKTKKKLGDFHKQEIKFDLKKYYLNRIKCNEKFSPNI